MNVKAKVASLLEKHLGKTPTEQMGETFAEASGLGTATHGVALLNHKGVLEDTRRRTEDSHRMQMQALGQESGGEPGVYEGDEMGGDVNVSGDTINVTLPPDRPPAAESPATIPSRTGVPSSAITKWLLPAALMAGSGLGGAALMKAFSPAVPAAAEDTDTRYEFGISSPDDAK